MAVFWHVCSDTSVTSDTNDTSDTILLGSCSAFQVTAHDDAHGAFMTLPPYTSTREGEAPQLGSDPTPCRLGLCVRKYPQPWAFTLEPRNISFLYRF